MNGQRRGTAESTAFACRVRWVGPPDGITVHATSRTQTSHTTPGCWPHPAGAGEALDSATAPDAAGRVTLDLPAESEEVAFAQLAGLGADAEALAPAGLRARFREHAQAMAALYAQQPEDQR